MNVQELAKNYANKQPESVMNVQDLAVGYKPLTMPKAVEPVTFANAKEFTPTITQPINTSPIQMTSTPQKVSLLSEAFDTQPYNEKWQEGNYGGAVANFLGSGLTGLQSTFLNAANNVGSVLSGEGLQPFQYNMSGADYQQAVVDRTGGKTLNQMATEVNPILGAATSFAYEVLTDPLELTPIGAVNDIKNLDKTRVGSQAYESALQNNKLIEQLRSFPQTVSRAEAVGQATNQAPTQPTANTAVNVQDLAKTASPQTVETVIETPTNINQLETIPTQTVNTTPKQAVSIEEMAQGKMPGIVNPVEQVTPTTIDPIRTAEEIETLNFLNTLAKENNMTAKEIIEAVNPQKQIDEATEALANYIYTMKPQGVTTYQVATDYGGDGNYLRASHNEPLYSKHYKRYGKKPTKYTANEMATEMIQNELRGGNAGFLTQDILNDYQMYTNFKNALEPDTSGAIDALADFRPNGINKGVKVEELANAVETMPRGADVLPTAQNTVTGQTTGLKDLGADINRQLGSMEEYIDKYGMMPKGVELQDAFGNKITRDIDLPKGTEQGEVSRGARTLAESELVSDTLLKEIEKGILEGSFSKATKKNKVVMENAALKVDSNIDTAYSTFKNNAQNITNTSDDIALGTKLLQQLQKNGDFERAYEVAEDLTLMLSEAGRTLQASMLIKKFSPEGMLRTVSKMAKKIEETTGYKPKVSDNALKSISIAENDVDKMNALKQAQIEMWDTVPATWAEKTSAWRYLAMLGNPKTHLRNILGNALFSPLRFAKDATGMALEKAFKVQNPTKAITNSFNAKDRAYLNYAKNDYTNIEPVLKNELKYETMGRPLEATVFNNKIIEGLRRFNSNMLEFEDTIFLKRAYQKSLAGYMKANKLDVGNLSDKALEKARDYAILEAQKATYRDFNSLSNLISRTKTKASQSPRLSQQLGGMALSAVMPFSKTPVNLLRRGIEYSPIGLVNGINDMVRNVKKGTVTPEEGLDKIAAGLSGTGVVALGAFLYNQGLVTTKVDGETSKESSFYKSQGQQDYSLNLDGNSYTINWLAPSALPFFVGAEMAKTWEQNGIDLATGIESLSNIMEPAFELSVLQGFNDILKTDFSSEQLPQLAQNLTENYLSQYLPTVGGQIARVIDPVRRNPYSTETGFKGSVETFARKQLNKIPFATSINPAYIDQWGQEDVTESLPQRLFEQFVSPGYLGEENSTYVNNELNSLVEDLKNAGLSDDISSVLPVAISNKTITKNGEEYRMTEEEFTQFSKTRGLRNQSGLNELFKTSKYKQADLEDKQTMIRNVYSEALKAAQNQYFRSHGIKVD